MKLNQDWDYIYHSTSLGLQHKVGALQEEVAALKLQAQSLSAKLEHEQVSACSGLAPSLPPTQLFSWSVGVLFNILKMGSRHHPQSSWLG